MQGLSPRWLLNALVFNTTAVIAETVGIFTVRVITLTTHERLRVCCRVAGTFMCLRRFTPTRPQWIGKVRLVSTCIVVTFQQGLWLLIFAFRPQFKLFTADWFYSHWIPPTLMEASGSPKKARAVIGATWCIIRRIKFAVVRCSFWFVSCVRTFK